MAAAKKSTHRVRNIILIVLLLFVISASLKIWEDVFASNIDLPEDKKAYIYVGTRLTLDENIERWESSGIIKHISTLARLIRLLGFEHKLKPGKYEVTSGVSNYDLIKMMAGGRQKSFDIVFKYAERKTDLASFWGKQLEADSNELIGLLNDTTLFTELGLDSLNSILVFIPNTYNFYWNTPAEDLLLRMKKEYQQFWNETRRAQADSLGLTPQQVAVLASIVQKETYQKKEMPVVAGVYYNRLQNGMPFQADPTILYVVNDKSVRRVAGDMLRIQSPYNTYINRGLIPGPICVPSVQAVDAVLNLQKHNYIYFCAREDFSGFHNFASSFAQHQINARKYQRELNRRGIH